MVLDRRQMLIGAGAAAVALASGDDLDFQAQAQDILKPVLRPIPSTGEEIPIVGLGSWITFNVGNDPVLLKQCTQVIGAFFENGGRMIDSSPMYGSSQATIGHALNQLGTSEDTVLAADKVWTSYPSEGPAQIGKTQGYWGIETLDLMQVHNLLAWRAHLDLLKAMKSEGKIRYIGITTSHGRRHDELADILESQAIDFVQLTYNVLDREVEQRLLPIAKDKGIAVIVNRPFRRGDLISRFAGKPLPDWSAEIGADSWAQFLLKFAISHPAVTCAIPATTRVDHVIENLRSAAGPLPDQKMRARMAAYVVELQ